MKLRRSSFPLLAVFAYLSGHAAAATNQYWNFGGIGGDGIWGTGPGDKNWNLAAGAAVGNTTWPDTNNDVAVFQDALGGTVTVFDPALAAGLSQTGANYTLDAGTITLVPDAASAAPFVNVQAGTLTLQKQMRFQPLASFSCSSDDQRLPSARLLVSYCGRSYRKHFKRFDFRLLIGC